MIKLQNGILINKDELDFRFSRSSGPGGQNVNKVNTRVTVFFHVRNSPSFSEHQTKRILNKLATRADKNGVIRVVSQKFRTQKANRNAAVERLRDLLNDALKKKPPRKKTRIPLKAKLKRLEEKRKRSLLKKQRAKIDPTAD
jgi:ribosome-associated protein